MKKTMWQTLNDLWPETLERFLALDLPYKKKHPKWLAGEGTPRANLFVMKREVRLVNEAIDNYFKTKALRTKEQWDYYAVTPLMQTTREWLMMRAAEKYILVRLKQLYASRKRGIEYVQAAKKADLKAIGDSAKQSIFEQEQRDLEDGSAFD